MILALLSSILSIVSPITIVKEDNSTQPVSSSTNYNLTGQYIYYSGNYYETFFRFSNTHDNQYGNTYNTIVYLTDNNEKLPLYSVEFVSLSNAHYYQLSISQFGATKEFLKTSNFTCSLLISFFRSGASAPAYQLATPLYQDSDFAFDSGDRYLTKTCLASDRGFSGFIYNSQYQPSSDATFDSGITYNDVYFSIVWQYQTPYNDVNGSYYDGYEEGYKVGGEEWFDTGYNTGYSEGYNNALATFNESNEVFVSSVASILEIGLLPVNIFMTLLDIEVFGINIGAFVSSLITIVVITILLRTLLGGKGGKDD